MSDAPNPPTPPDPHAAGGPTRICPHCSAQSQVAGPKCPHCGKKFRKRSGLKVALIVVVVFAVLVGGCSALFIGGLGVAANEVSKEIEKEEASGITAEQFEAIGTGMSRDEVEAELGTPEDVQESEIDLSELGEGVQSSDCIYYDKAGELASMYQLCFTDDVLESKASY